MPLPESAVPPRQAGKSGLREDLLLMSYIPNSLFCSYMSQLYYRICPVDWDDSCEPTLIKGVHHGPDVAQPFSIESGQHSRCFVSDYLWSLVPTSW
uniref:Uncharacterized protein n=1 Tax=Sphaerodactylus townsendi TaxID=933632 RepID=A0ACB8ELU7_9SAUR